MKKYNIFNWKKLKLFLIIITSISIILLPIFIITINLMHYFYYCGVIKISLEKILINFLNHKIIILGYSLVAWLFFVIVALIYFSCKKPKKEVTTKATTNKAYGQAKWLTMKEFNNICPLVKLETKNINDHGWVVASQESREGLQCNIKSNTHYLVLGSTNSGKTDSIVKPTIALNARSIYQPSMIITDLKSELIREMSLDLEQQGYIIKRINLKQGGSNFWNPLKIIYDYWIQTIKIEKSIKEYQEINKKHRKLLCYLHKVKQCSHCLTIKGFYTFDNKIFINFNQLLQVKNNQIITLQALAREQINDITTTLIPQQNNDKAFFSGIARNSLQAIILAMLEDLSNKPKALTLKQFNLASVRFIITKGQIMREWLANRVATSPARIAAAAILEEDAKETLANFVQTMLEKLTIFTDPRIQTITCQNDINLSTIDEKPTAIFIELPDDRTDKNIFASLFMSQLYKALIQKADANNGKLLRPVYFICDEFGNMPAINGLERVITTVRSRLIQFMFIIQDKYQLLNQYGQNAYTIINNCMLQAIVKTKDYKVAQEYSQMIGDQTVIKVGTSNSKNNINTNESLVGIKLIKAEELQMLKKGQAIILQESDNPIKVNFFPYSQSKSYISGIAKNITKEFNFINIENYYYHIEDNNIENFNPNLDEQQLVVNEDNNEKYFQQLKNLKKQLNKINKLIQEQGKQEQLIQQQEQLRQKIDQLTIKNQLKTNFKVN